MSKDNLKIKLTNLDELWKTHWLCRSLLPSIEDGCIGQIGILNAPIYNGQDVFLYADKPLSKKVIEDIRFAAHYNNKNFIVRLFALLESYSVKTCEEDVEGWEHFNVLRRLRNHYAHGSGKLDHDNAEDVKLDETMVTLYNLTTPSNDSSEFRLPIDDVLYPMFIGCREYVENYL